MSVPTNIKSPPLAEAVLGCTDLAPALRYFTEDLGFRVEVIFPAEEPRVASLSGHGLRLRLTPDAAAPGHVRIPTCAALPVPKIMAAPNGTVVEVFDPHPTLEIPSAQQAFVVTRANDAEAGEGRAGMLYRDLIPSRLGGRFVASHISIPHGGPVADWVHFHKVRFQMIFCRAGWVRLVYEDQGEPFILSAGDCVLQPPEIRHRVLESSDGLEVVEIGCPALHETLADHNMALPTGRHLPDRDFGGQIFLRHVAAHAPWVPLDGSGFEVRDTGMSVATGGLADARVLRPLRSRNYAAAPHSGEFLFGFLLEGSVTLHHAGVHALGRADAFVIPAHSEWQLEGGSSDLMILQVTLPAMKERL